MMRSKKKRLRRQANHPDSPRPTFEQMTIGMSEAFGGPGGFAKILETPPIGVLFQVDQSPEARAHYDAIDEGLRQK